MIHGIETITALNKKRVEELKALSCEEKERRKRQLEARTKKKKEERIVCEGCKNVVLENRVIAGLCGECRNDGQ